MMSMIPGGLERGLGGAFPPGDSKEGPNFGSVDQRKAGPVAPSPQQNQGGGPPIQPIPQVVFPFHSHLTNEHQLMFSISLCIISESPPRLWLQSLSACPSISHSFQQCPLSFYCWRKFFPCSSLCSNSSRSHCYCLCSTNALLSFGHVSNECISSSLCRLWKPGTAVSAAGSFLKLLSPCSIQFFSTMLFFLYSVVLLSSVVF